MINTIMYGISKALAGLSGAAAAVLMYLFQSVFNFFVVSGSGQAAVTMPIMAPLADPAGSYPSDFGTCFPAGRCIYQSDRSDFRMSDRFSGYCQNRVVQLDQVHVEIPGCVDDRCCDHDFDCGWNRILMMVLFTETD